MYLLDPFDLHAWDGEANIICNDIIHSSNHSLTIHNCRESIITFGVNTIKTLKELNTASFIHTFDLISPDILPKEQRFINRYDIFHYALIHTQEFNLNTPWPHMVIDNMFNPLLINKVVKELDEIVGKHDIKKNSRVRLTNSFWRQFDDVNQRKHGLSNPYQLGVHTNALIAEMKSLDFVEFLERLTGIAGLIPDPFDAGGGVHIIYKDGYLKPHTDFPFHTHLRLWRRVNVLLYLNEHWEEEWGGQLQLWGNENEPHLSKAITPLLNRLVVFRTDNRSLHGHPEPLKCPMDKQRRSIALYYYTSDILPDENIMASTTSFVEIKAK